MLVRIYHVVPEFISRANVRQGCTPEDLPRMLSAVKRRCQALGGNDYLRIQNSTGQPPRVSFQLVEEGACQGHTFRW